MASYAQNPYYDDPFLTQAASNIAKVFIDGNPGRTAAQRAQARLYTLQGDKLDRESQKRSSIANTFRKLNGRSPTAQEFAQITGDSIEGDMKPGDTANHTLYYQSNTGQPDSVIARSFVGAGHGLNKGEGVSLGDREGIRTRDAANDRARSDSSAGIAANASMTNARLAEEGRMARRDDAPIHVTPGSGLILRPGDSRRPSGMVDGEVAVPVPAKPTADRYVQSQDADGNPVWRLAEEGIPGPVKPAHERFVESEDPNNPGKNVYVKAKEGIAGKAIKEPPTPKMSETELAAMEYAELTDMGALVPGPDGNSSVPDPKFEELYGTKRAAAREAMSDTLQSTKSAAKARDAYRKTLGIDNGAKLDKPSLYDRTFNGAKPTMRAPVGSPVQDAFRGGGAQAAQPPAAAAPAPVPPPQARVPGQTYSTPKGPMTWTPDGWIPAR